MRMIELRNVTKCIKGNMVLRDVNCKLESGQIYGLVGRNGSGKTMLLRMMAGLILPTQGQVIVDGEPLHKTISFPKDMGILIEKPEMMMNLSGMENLKLLAEIRGAIEETTIREYMQLFSLDPDSRQPVKKYSLGMKQKIGIIQALMEDPSLLLLDEPFNALDEHSVELLRKLLLKCKKEGKLVVITSHHREDIEAVCDSILPMEEGRIDSRGMSVWIDR